MFEGDVIVSGRKVHYLHSGNGQNIVLLHGIPTHSGLWNGIISELEKNYSVYAFDLLGFGKSVKLDSNELDLKHQAHFFCKVFKKIGLKDIIIVGHDIGGGIAQIMALSHPEMFKAMILVDSVCYDSWPIQVLSEQKKVEMLFKHLPQDVVHDTFIEYVKGGLYNKDKALEVGEKYWPYMKGAVGMKDFLNIVRSFDNRHTLEASHLLGTIKMPVFIIWGKHDIYLRPSYGYRLSEDIKGASIKVIDTAGHFLPEDQPELASELIDNFIRSIR